MNSYGVPINQIPKALRTSFVPDPGYVFVGADYKAGESHIVAYLSGDERYIEAHEGQYDPHTYVCRLTRPELPWSGDPVEDKELAETTLAPNGKDIRFLAKSTQHGSNLGGAPRTLAINAGVPIADMERAQRTYFETFPRIREWQRWVKYQVRENKRLTLPMRAEGPDMRLTRVFFNRPWSEDTYREALAFMPQGMLAVYTHGALIRCFEALEGPDCHAVIHNHDQLVFQVRHEGTAEQIRRYMEWPIEITDFTGTNRTLTLKVDLKIGKNWKMV